MVQDAEPAAVAFSFTRKKGGIWELGLENFKALFSYILLRLLRKRVINANIPIEGKTHSFQKPLQHSWALARFEGTTTSTIVRVRPTIACHGCTLFKKCVIAE